MANQIVVSAGAKVRNLSGVLTATSGVVSFLPIDVSLGIPQLDVNGKILVSQLPNSVMEYKGTWDASTNTPTLANGTGNQGDVYLCNVAGTVNFGAGPIAFVVGDQVIYSGSIWQRASGSTGTVTSVAITESGDSLNITGSPITTSGTINIGFNGTNLQYVNGAGNLTTFPILTGYVPYTGATANLNLGIYSFIANDGAYNTEMSPSYFGVENAAGTIFGLLEYNKLTLTNSTGAGSTMIVNAQGLIFPDASVQISSYTDAKARLALSLTTTGTSGVATYNNTTGVFNIPNYGSALTGYVPYTGATQDVDLGAFKLNAQSLHIKGTGGNGHLGLKHQSASATASANEVSLFADSLGDLSWLNGNLYLSKFITSGNTAARSYTFPNANGTVALTSDLSNYVDLTTAQTIGGTKTFTDATKNNGGIFLQNASSSSLAGYMNLGGLTNGLKFTSGGGISNSFTLPSATGYTFTFPNATGTIALTSDIPSLVGYVPYTGATGAVDLGVNSLSASYLYLNGATSPMSGQLNMKIGTTSPGNTGGYYNILPYSDGKLYFTSYLSSLSNTRIFILDSAGITANTPRTFTFPDASGTIALVGGSGVGTVTSVAALTIGTSGTDLSSSVANSTTTPVITLNVPTASAANRGALSSADWTTFNSKQGTITLTTTGTSGAATFSSNTLNIPNYAPDLSGYVTLATTQTISGLKTFSSNLTAYGTLTIGQTGVTNGIINSNDGMYFNIDADASGSTPEFMFGKGRSGTSGGTTFLTIANTGAATFSANIASSAYTNGTLIVTGGVGISGQIFTNNTINTTDGYYSSKAGSDSIGSGAYMQFSNIGYIQANASSGLDFWTLPTGGGGWEKRMRLTNGGNFLIGTTTDSGYKLDVNGTGRFSGALTSYNNGLGLSLKSTTNNGSYLEFAHNSAGTYAYIGSAYHLLVSPNNIANNLAIRAEGDLVLTTGGYTPRLTIASTGAATLSNLAGTGSRAVLADANGLLSAPVSDISVKQNITPIGYGLNEISKMNPVWFDFIDEYKNFGEGRQNGNIAQEMEAIIPEAVFTTPSTGKKGINYDQLHAVYIKAIQQLEERIKQLENK